MIGFGVWGGGNHTDLLIKMKLLICYTCVGDSRRQKSKTIVKPSIIDRYGNPRIPFFSACAFIRKSSLDRT
jgi:hypothetical protein